MYEAVLLVMLGGRHLPLRRDLGALREAALLHGTPNAAFILAYQSQGIPSCSTAVEVENRRRMLPNSCSDKRCSSSFGLVYGVARLRRLLFQNVDVP